MPERTKFTDGPERCLHCENVSRLIIVCEYSTVKSYYGDFWHYDAGDIWQTLKCEACGNVSLRSAHYDDRYEDAGIDAWHTLYPASRAAPRGLPKQVGLAYEAALRVRPVEPNEPACNEVVFSAGIGHLVRRPESWRALFDHVDRKRP